MKNLNAETQSCRGAEKRKTLGEKQRQNLWIFSVSLLLSISALSFYYEGASHGKI